jgi:hypothetical protein
MKSITRNLLLAVALIPRWRPYFRHSRKREVAFTRSAMDVTLPNETGSTWHRYEADRAGREVPYGEGRRRNESWTGFYAI